MDGLNIVFVGDMKYGRTVKSLAKLLGVVGNSNTLSFIAPDELRLPGSNRRELEDLNVKVYESDILDDVIDKADVLYVTRVQKEWFENQMDLYERIKDNYIVNNEVMKKAKKKMIVMHPLPRVNEISTEVDSDPRSKYFDQMRSGLYVRMAILKLILKG